MFIDVLPAYLCEGSRSPVTGVTDKRGTRENRRVLEMQECRRQENKEEKGEEE